MRHVRLGSPSSSPHKGRKFPTQPQKEVGSRVDLGIFAEIVENGSKWLELSELNRFRHAQIDSETLGKIWISDPDPTGFDSDLPEPAEPLYRF